MLANKDLVLLIGSWIELFGVFIIVVGLIIATVIYLYGLFTGKSKKEIYNTARYNLGRGILLGLEVLIAGDIIITVTGTPTLLSVSVLGIIVLIRVVLSFTLTTEIEGRWPWQSKKD